jgi:archaellum biogenesis ATPase FlaH
LGWLNPMSREATNTAASPFQSPIACLSGSPLEVSLAHGTSPFVPMATMLIDLNETISPDSVHPHIIEKLIPQGEVTLLSGHGGSGKSYISLLMLVHVAMGLRFGKLEVQRTRCLFFSAEDDKAELLRRVAKICRILDVKQSDLMDWLFLVDASEIDPALYRVDIKGNASPTTQLKSLAELVRHYDIGLTVIDNASDVFEGNEVVRAQVRGFIRTLRNELARPKRAVVLLAHVSKLAAQNRKYPSSSIDEDYSGSTAWHNSVRSRMSLDTDNNDGSMLKHLKANKGPKAAQMRLEWYDGTPVITEGTNVAPKALMAAALHKEREEVRKERDKVKLVELISGLDAQGTHVPVADKGRFSTFKTLSQAPDFPNDFTTDLVNSLVKELVKDGRLFIVERRTKGRKKVKCYGCAHTLPESAPSQAIDISEPAAETNEGKQ